MYTGTVFQYRTLSRQYELDPNTVSMLTRDWHTGHAGSASNHHGPHKRSTLLNNHDTTTYCETTQPITFKQQTPVLNVSTVLIVSSFLFSSYTMVATHTAAAVLG